MNILEASINKQDDIHKLFESFNKQFFFGKLQNVEVRWSPRMTSCAGVCVSSRSRNYCSVRLSSPLLKLRPHSDLVETMLHEMIHAYLFVTKYDDKREGHGPEFHKHMDRINKQAGTNITVYHSFHNEVRLYQQHWWRCNGMCQNKGPYFGMVKRSMNREPGPGDRWWNNHQSVCGGKFVKIREPIEYTMKKAGKKKSAKDIRYTVIKDVTNFKSVSSLVSKDLGNVASVVLPRKYGLENIVGFVDLTNSILTSTVTQINRKESKTNNLLEEIDLTDDRSLQKNKNDLLCKCPVCNKELIRDDMNDHMEICEGLQDVLEVDLSDDFEEEEEVKELNKTQKLCPICGFAVKEDMKAHVDDCMNNSGLINIFDDHASDADSPLDLSNATTESGSEVDLSNNNIIKLNKNYNQSKGFSSDITNISEYFGKNYQELTNNSLATASSPYQSKIIDLSDSDNDSPMGACSVQRKVPKQIPTDDLIIVSDYGSSKTFGILDEPVIDLSNSESPAAIKVPKPIISYEEADIQFLSDIDSSINDNQTKVPKPIVDSEARVACHACGMKYGVSKFNDHICYY